jgi:hypothetical protein
MSKKIINGDVNLDRLYLDSLPDFLVDVHISGDFYCFMNNLQSLEGAPKSVGGNFGCSYSSLQTLSGAPLSVGGYFSCAFNNLQSLEGAPKSVGDNFYCNNNAVVFTEEQVRAVCDVKGKVYV